MSYKKQVVTEARRQMFCKASRKYYWANREKVNAKRRGIPVEHNFTPEQVQRRLEAARRWKERNNERLREFAHSESERERCRRKSARRRLQIADSRDPYTRDEIIERDAQVCWLCGLFVKLEDLHLDHKVPLVLGGPDTAANVAVSHSRCNLSKGGRMVAA